MAYWKKIIRLIDQVVNGLIIMCFVPLLLYGVYVLWDSAQINQQANSQMYATYRPSEDDVSFEELKKINPEVFGWLTLYDTNVNYPLLQAENNSKYVNLDAKGNFALSGSIFLDFRNSKDFSDVNHVIYGHQMAKDAMFGELESFSDEAYFNNHRYGAIYYDGEWHGIELFAFLLADAYDSMLYNTEISQDESQSYVAYVKEQAMHYRNLDMESNERYVTLSTCTSNSTNGRHLLIGRITEHPEKDLLN